MEPAKKPRRAYGKLGKGFILSLLLHVQALGPLVIAARILGERQAAQRAEEVDVSFQDVPDADLADLPPLEPPPQRPIKDTPRKQKPEMMAEKAPVEAEPPPEVVVPPLPPMPEEKPPTPKPPPPREHEKMVDLDMGQEVEPPPDAKYLAQKNNRAEEETRATDTNLEAEQKGGEASSPSERQEERVGDAEQKIAELEDVESALGRQAPRVTPRVSPELRREEETEARSESLLSMRDIAARDHRLTPETADPSLPREADGMLPLPAEPGVRGAQEQSARRSGKGAKLKLQLTGDDYEYVFGAEAEAERRLAQKDRSKRTGRHEKRWGRIQSALENFIPEVRPGNQTALNTRAAPFAAFIARMHRSIHKLWGFGLLEDWDGKASSNAFNNPNLIATLELVLNGDGTVDKVTVIQPSGYLPYDVAAIDTVYSAGPYPEPPREVRSGNGKIYIHWRFHRDHRQCATSGVDYYILDNAPAGGDRGEQAAAPPRPAKSGGGIKFLPGQQSRPAGAEEGASTPSSHRESEEEGHEHERRPRRLSESDPRQARLAAAQVVRADDPDARSAAERWFAALVKGDAAAMADRAALPFRSGDGVVADSQRELRRLFQGLLDELPAKRALRSLQVYSAAGARGALGPLPPAVADERSALFAVGHIAGDTFVLVLAKREGLFKALALVRR